jgi:predicted phage terminase large subunit-like protein
VRYWDLAATEPGPANRDPDWTVGLRLEWHRASGDFFITDIVRERRGPGAIEALVKATAERDGREVGIVIEREPGSAGALVADRYRRHVLAGFNVREDTVSRDKYTRATPVAAAAEHGLIKIVRGRHASAFLDELSAFPHGRHDDCVDALAGAYQAVTRYGGGATISLPPRGLRVPSALEAARNADRWRPLGGRLDAEGLAAFLGVPFNPAHPEALRRRTARRR